MVSDEAIQYRELTRAPEAEAPIWLAYLEQAGISGRTVRVDGKFSIKCRE